MKYRNPIIPGFYPDSSICRKGEDYYLVNSSFHYFPGVPIFHSRDLINWSQIGHCLTRNTQLFLEATPSSHGIFAPTLRYHNSTFYMITTNVSLMKNFFVTAANPEGPWSEPVWVDWEGIDPSLFFDDDGKVYITGTNGFDGEAWGIYQAEIDINTGELLSPRIKIWDGTGGRNPEGPHLYKIKGQYYLMISEGGTEYGHMITIARSDHPNGPFVSNPHNPIGTHRSLESPFQAIGHADLIQAHDGTWWAVTLGIRPISFQSNLGRETFLTPVEWTEDDWPRFGSGHHSVDEIMEGPAFMTTAQREWEIKDDFISRDLSVEWNFLRNPDPATWSLDTRPGALTLYGTEISLDDQNSPAFVGRRQQHHRCLASVNLDFKPVQDGEEAGLTVYQNEKFHYEIALTRIDGICQIILRRRIGELWKMENRIPYPNHLVTLEIKADETHYNFSYSDVHGNTADVGKGERGLLSSEVAGGFTGVYIGMYATGNGKTSMNPAYFESFIYRPDRGEEQ